MMQDLAVRHFPGNTVASTSITFSFRFRATENVGSYQTIGSIPDLSISFPAGRNDALTHASLVDLVVSHLLNNGLASSWQPEIGTVESSLRATLDGLLITNGYSGIPQIMLLFNGQFGPVTIG